MLVLVIGSIPSELVDGWVIDCNFIVFVVLLYCYKLLINAIVVLLSIAVFSMYYAV
jgi:hypothetical protein